MTDLNEIIRDLNITIADVETLQAELPMKHNELVRGIGQLKAARASLVRLNQDKEVIHYVTSTKES